MQTSGFLTPGTLPMQFDAAPRSRARRLATRLVGSLSLLFIAPSWGTAQNPVQPIFTMCPTSTRVYSAREVQVAARPLADSIASIQIVASPPRSAANTIAFVVDTLGLPEANSLAALHIADSTLWHRAEAEFRQWRFQPARASGCKVRQRVVAVIMPSAARTSPG